MKNKFNRIKGKKKKYEEMTIVYCKSYGKQIATDSKFCRYCDEKQQIYIQAQCT